MAKNVSGEGIIEGELVEGYPSSIQKREHELLIEHYFGSRCPDHHGLCWCCHAWMVFDQYWDAIEESLEANVVN